MRLIRRDFLRWSTKGTLGAALGMTACSINTDNNQNPFAHLKPMTDGVQPITDEERWQRIEKAHRLMRKHRMDAVFLDATTSMSYFTGLEWWQSERMRALILPAVGEPAYVVPAFEAPDLSKEIRFGSDIRTWEENESPFDQAIRVFKDRGIRFGRIGMEERVRFFLFDGIRKSAHNLEFVNADPVVMECRLIKSPAEIALMQRATDITVEVYKAVLPLWKEGMTAGEFRDLTRQAHAALGVSGGIGAQIGEASSYPHGSSTRPAREGDVILMDGGCGVEGYRSDISRTIVLGEPMKKQREMWNLAKKAISSSV